MQYLMIRKEADGLCRGERLSYIRKPFYTLHNAPEFVSYTPTFGPALQSVVGFSVLTAGQGFTHRPPLYPKSRPTSPVHGRAPAPQAF
ncbi:hypothetical protein LZ24_02025 [Desulfobotulus alkaliphilus]|uniref:Uncharacterized protein n=1 Tax=Desulfobotulus alkaliphilus TaxID=622671 RepID=A0A562RQ52_9BACT|nr:hypothetical protein LZ24_02025 [Desulfobotulus alkaliphilus]